MSNTRNKKTNTKMIGLCTVCEQYYKPEFYTIKRIESGKDPVVICNTCLNKRSNKNELHRFKRNIKIFE